MGKHMHEECSQERGARPCTCMRSVVTGMRSACSHEPLRVPWPMARPCNFTLFLSLRATVSHVLHVSVLSCSELSLSLHANCVWGPAAQVLPRPRGRPEEGADIHIGAEI